MASPTKAWAGRVHAAGVMSWRSATPWSRRLLLAAGAAFVLSTVVAVYVPRQVEHEMWYSELDTDRATLAGLVTEIDVPPRSQAELDRLDAFARGALLRGDYVRVKLWDPEGTVLYSDDATLIGRSFPVEGGLRAALAGSAFDEVSGLDRAENEREQGIADRVLEVYVPVERNGRVVAVWEVYRSLDRFDAAMSRIRWGVWASVGGALLLLLAVSAGLLGTLLRSLRRRSEDAAALSSQLGTLLAVAKETSRSLDSRELGGAAVAVIRAEAGFDGVGLLRGTGPSREVVAISQSGECPRSCLLEGAVGAVRRDGECATLDVEVPAGDDDLVLVACRAGNAPFTAPDEIVLRAAAESVAMAWDNARLYERLARAESTQRHLTRKLVDTHEDERRTIVGDIHDGLGQDLHRVLYGLRRVQTDPNHSDDDLAKLERMVEASIGDLRRLLRSLRPTTLEDLGLLPALRSLVASANDDGEMLVDLRTDAIPDLDMPARLAIYRIVQEALHNALKHGHAHHASVDLTVVDHVLATRVDDDGSGYQPGDSDGLGVWLMRERAEAVGGHLDIRSVDGGTTVEARIPIGGNT